MDSWKNKPKYIGATWVRDEPDVTPLVPRWAVRRVRTAEGLLVFEQAIVPIGRGRRRTLQRPGTLDGRRVEVDEINRLLAGTAAAKASRAS